MQVFELPEMTEILGMPLTKAKNWAAGRPFKFPASIRTASGTGTRNLYSVEDLYLLGLANEFSKAGFAAMAIGKLLESVDSTKLTEMGWLTVWRAGTLKFHVREGKTPPPEGVLLWHTVNAAGLVKRIAEGVEKLGRGAK